MFDLVAGKSVHVPSTPAIPIVISTTVQGTALAVITALSLVFATTDTPVVPDMLAFVTEVPVAPPPPPPPAAPVAKQVAAPKAASAAAVAVPIVAPHSIEPELAAVTPFDDEEEGLPGGVEGGISSGVVAGMTGFVEGPPPPAPPAPAAKLEITRIGGQIKAPALLRRVEPVYPGVAQSAGIEGAVILDAIVDAGGHVQAVTLLRGHAVLVKAAVEAVRQWQYEPLLLNGVPAPFELTVSLWFHFDNERRR